MKRSILIEHLDLFGYADMMRRDYCGLLDKTITVTGFKLIKSKKKLKEITGNAEVLVSIPCVYIMLSNRREFIIDRAKRAITRVGGEWVGVKDSGWYEWN